jgi:hypothetical protein
VATGRLGARTRLRIVDTILSGTHEPGSSHYQLLRAFAGDETLALASAALDAHGYLTHEFGDSVLIERGAVRRRWSMSLRRSEQARECYWLSNNPRTFPSVSEMRA